METVTVNPPPSAVIEGRKKLNFKQMYEKTRVAKNFNPAYNKDYYIMIFVTFTDAIF